MCFCYPRSLPRHRVHVVLSLALAAAGCQSGSTADSGPPVPPACGDLGAALPFPPDSGIPPLSCGGDCTDFVWDDISMPLSSADASRYAVNKEGKSYNALGGLLTTVNQYLKASVDMKPAVAYGQTLVLLRVQAKSLSDDTQVKAQLWVGESRSCCDSSSSRADCVTQARTTCFDGKSAFQPAAGGPTPLVLQGSISGGRLDVGQGPFVLRFVSPLDLTVAIDLPLVQARLRGKVTSGRISEGILSGGIPAWAVRKRLVPLLVTILDRMYRGSQISDATRTALRSTFDIDNNGTITLCELEKNQLLSTFLNEDVDLDGDGTKELSMGFGFTAVGAVIHDGQGPGDQGAEASTLDLGPAQ